MTISGADLTVVSAVKSLTPLIRAECAGVDKTRVIPSSVIQQLQNVGVFRLMAPREIGGAEIDPVTFFEVVEAASYADGSVGWCVMIGGCYATFGGMLPAAGAAHIFGNSATISAGAFRPDGQAVEVDGGYKVSGRWPLASGSSHANWYIGGCVVVRNGQPVMTPNGAPLMREVFFPASVTKVIDTWDSTGLRGTASHDYAVSDVFVPADHTLWFQEPPTCQHALYRMPPIAMFSTFIGAVPLGIARHAIDEFMTFAKGKTPALQTGVVAEKAVAQATLGRAHAMVSAARMYLVETLRDLWKRVEAGHAPTLVDRGKLWVAATHAGHTALDAIGRLYSAAGATAVYATSPLDRCLRDARTAAQHICLHQANFEIGGRQLVGGSVIPGIWGMDYRGEV